MQGTQGINVLLTMRGIGVGSWALHACVSSLMTSGPSQHSSEGLFLTAAARFVFMRKLGLILMTCFGLGACASERQTVGTAAGVAACAVVAGPIGAVVGGAAGAIVTAPRSYRRVYRGPRRVHRRRHG